MFFVLASALDPLQNKHTDTDTDTTNTRPAQPFANLYKKQQQKKHESIIMGSLISKQFRNTARHSYGYDYKHFDSSFHAYDNNRIPTRTMITTRTMTPSEVFRIHTIEFDTGRESLGTRSRRNSFRLPRWIRQLTLNYSIEYDTAQPRYGTTMMDMNNPYRLEVEEQEEVEELSQQQQQQQQPPQCTSIATVATDGTSGTVLPSSSYALVAPSTTTTPDTTTTTTTNMVDALSLYPEEVTINKSYWFPRPVVLRRHAAYDGDGLFREW